MSYFVFLESRSGRPIEAEAFAGHFKGRRHYAVDEWQAVYENEGTGVSFSFDAPAEGAVGFSLETGRPHVFALEAAEELAAFAEAFDAVVAPGLPGDAWTPWPYDAERFLREWGAANRLAYRALAREPGWPEHTWPARRIREVWAWNRARPADETLTAEDIYRPAIFAAELDGVAQSLAAWPAGVAVLLPPVDAVLVPVEQAGERSRKPALARWEEILPAIERYRVDGDDDDGGGGPAHYRLAFDEAWPIAVAAFLFKERPALERLTTIHLGDVLDRELVEEARREAGGGR